MAEQDKKIELLTSRLQTAKINAKWLRSVIDMCLRGKKYSCYVDSPERLSSWLTTSSLHFYRETSKPPVVLLTGIETWKLMRSIGAPVFMESTIRDIMTKADFGHIVVPSPDDGNFDVTIKVYDHFPKHSFLLVPEKD